MSSIQSLGISGIRGYTPDNYQMIEFMKPLTLIWGKNGSGKTTIIQCLKYITTGSLPPNSDKGKSFIMDTKVAGRPQVIGDIRFIFNYGNRPILAKRKILLSAKGNQLKFQSIEQFLKTKDQNGKDITINHQCAEIQRQVPQFLGISKPILQNIVFCHQDESLWPFGDSVFLKGIFDELFETKRITKEMEKIWDVIKDQQAQLKQLKIRIQYQHQTFKRQLDERSRHFIQLQEIQIKSKQLKKIKKRIKKLGEGLQDNSQKIKQRQKLIYKKGRSENTIAHLQTKIIYWKQSFYKIDKEYESKMKGKNTQIGFEENSFSTSSRPHNIECFNESSTKIPSSQLQKVKMIPIQSPQKSIEQLEYKKSVYQSLKEQYKAAKEQHSNLKSFSQSSKRQQQIKSQIERVKSLIPELKFNKDIKNEDDFMRCLKSQINQMENKIKGIQITKRKMQKMQFPVVVELGFTDKQIEELRVQSKALQSEIKQLSYKIFKVYKSQYKQIPKGFPIERALLELKEYEKDHQNTEAIVKSKQQQLQHYQNLQKNKPKKNKQSLQDDYNHYKYAGIQLQEEMLHFCEMKGKCYFCSKQMTGDEIQQARQKVNAVRIKTQQRLKDIERKINNQKQITIDPEIMIKKLTQQISQLQLKRQSLQNKISKLQQAKLYQKSNQLNKSLDRQLDKCTLKIQMLQKVFNTKGNLTDSEKYFKELPIQKFIDISSEYQVKMIRYKSVKDQITKLQTNQQINQLNKIKRQEILKQRNQIQQQISKAQDQVRHLQFLKNSLLKLEPLIKMEAKSKQRKVTKQTGNESLKQNGSSQCSYSSVEQAAYAVNRLYAHILQEKFYIQKLRISINYHNDRVFLQNQKESYHVTIKQLEKLTTQLKTSQKILNQYNSLKPNYDKDSQRIKHRLSVLSQMLAEPLENCYLITLTKIKHLEKSIENLQLLHLLMEEAVSKYHSQKMEEINQYIYEVWKQIYHGQDIQYIQIEASTQQSSKKKKKNYQYKILMRKSTKNFKNQQKVQMKGRCSTGQKVLASIVIRLALAEVFCGSTRILALDQPTTNLDREHIINLANALLKLIELSGGKNLQLIVISHDIEFIKLLEPYAESYYEVKRDINKHSTIEKKFIKQIFQQ